MHGKQQSPKFTKQENRSQHRTGVINRPEAFGKHRTAG
jgi:hypothetical protein